MVVLRSVGLATLLVAALAAGGAKADTSLAAIDRNLNVLCVRLARASSAETAAIKSRLASLYRQRVSLLSSLSPERRAAALRGATVSQQCLTVARAEAGPIGGGGGGARHYHRYSAPRAAPPPTMPHSARRMDRSALPPVADAPQPQGHATLRPTPGTSAASPPSDLPRAPSSMPPQSAQLEEFFPWPPPAPSARALLRLEQLGGDRPATTWGDVADRLIAILRHGQFRSWGFYLAPGGFAAISQIEQLDDNNGEALAGDERWASETKVASTSVLRGIFTVRRPVGLYRVIAFVLTNDARSGGPVTDPGRMLQLARRWGISGALDLPQQLRVLPISNGQRLFALVYEFESAVGGETRVISPGRWTLEHHFRNAGLLKNP